MHFKFFFILFVLVSVVFGKEDVEILAKNVEKNGDIVHAKEEVVLYSQQYVMTADEAFYNTLNGDLELLGNITILDGIEYSSRTGKAEVNLNDNTGRMVPVFSYMGMSDLWIKCEEGLFDANSYISKKAITSSCAVQDPDWKIGFTTGEYNKESKFMSLYNSLFYIKDTPVFYLPYFSFSTDRTRRSGLLRPSFGIGSDEGFYYLQPIYIAPYQNWDLELDPQIRTNRGYGLNTIFRFADSPYSKGEVTFGGFREKENYANKNNLENDKHYGYSLYYDRSNLFSDNNDDTTEDGLVVDFQYLNDIDYLNTLDNKDISYNKLLTSKLNYYYKRDNDYFGVYGKYYIDTEKTSNDDTPQEIPTLHYHRFAENILKDNIYYSLDAKSTYYTRDEHYNVIANEVLFPISFHTPLLSEYLNFKFTNQTSILRVNYRNENIADNITENYGQFIQNTNIFSLYTELGKKYDNFYHTFYFELAYVKPSDDSINGYFVPENENPIATFTKDNENLALKLVQFFYDSEGEKRVAHSMRQVYYSDYVYKYGDLENTIKIYFDNGLSISNILNYSHQYAKTSKVQTSINWETDKYTLKLTHTHENDEDEEVTNFVSFSATTKYLTNYNVFSGIDYDIEDNFFKSWKFGWIYDRKCWNYTLTYKEDRTPKLTSSGTDYVKNRGIYLLFNIAQIGAINYDFVKTSGIDE